MFAIATEAQQRGSALEPGRRAPQTDTGTARVLQRADPAAGGPMAVRPSASLGGQATLQRCGCGGACCDSERRADLSRRAGSDAAAYAPSEALSAVSRPGRPLDGAARTALEPRFGADFGGVSIHDDAEAAAAADAVNARAYTIGQHVVFARGQYSPSTAGGRRLLAHELAHTIQQGPAAATAGSVRVSRSDGPLERDADQATVHATGGSRARPMASSGRALARQQGTGQAKPADPVEEARGIAWGRVFKVYARLSGIGPSPPPGREEAARTQRAAEQLELRSLARTIFDWPNPNMEQITEIVGQMRDYLGPGLKTVRAAANDQLCGLREAYVVNHSAPIHLCPAFYGAGRDRQVETLIHEAAHLAGIGEPDKEGYCIVFDCQGSCGGFSAADSWAHFIHCASGLAPQKPPDQVTGPRRAPSRTP